MPATKTVCAQFIYDIVALLFESSFFSSWPSLTLAYKSLVVIVIILCIDEASMMRESRVKTFKCIKMSQ